MREWQDSEMTSHVNFWFNDQPNWVDLVLSALKFLSGDILGI